jgi:hypothetical protein
MKALIAVPVFLLLPALSFGQAGESDTGEVATFVGGTYGSGAHFNVGGSSGIAFSRYGLGLLEVSYSSLGQDTLRDHNSPPTSTSRLFDINGSFHIRVPFKERWEPYGIVGSGFLWNSFFPAITRPDGISGVEHYHKVAFAFHTGGGVRYYIGEGWGIRPEVKVIVSTHTYVRASVGIFTKLPWGWP